MDETVDNYVSYLKELELGHISDFFKIPFKGTVRVFHGGASSIHNGTL